jgi:HlyD family secretion protein
MHNSLLNILISIFFLTGCSGKPTNIITYNLKHTDYLETIDATGTIQAVNKLMLLSPRINFSGVTVAHLAREGTHVLKGDTVCILDCPELSYYLDMFNSDLEKMEADQKKLVADNAMELAMLTAQIETNNAQLAISQLDSIQMKFATPVKKQLLGLEMEKVGIEKKKLQKKLAAQKLIDNSELSQIRSRIMMQKNRIQMYVTQKNSLKLVAPCDGVVMHYESPLMFFMGNGVGTRGGKIEEKSSVWSNMPLLQFPDMKEMQVSVEVPEADYKRIRENQKVQINVEAATNLITTGKIKRKTLAGKGAGEGSALKTYEVIISVDSRHNEMKPGLSAQCRIIVDEVKDTIVVPAAAIFQRDSSKIVYVAEGDIFIPVIIETGLSNMSRSIISKGLDGNEKIAMTEPPYNMVRKEVKSKSDVKNRPSIVQRDSVLKDSTIHK